HRDWWNRYGEKRKDAFCGSLADVSRRLADTLRRDHEKHVAESDEVPYDFDYVILPRDGPVGTLLIQTRLFGPVVRGCVLYGSVVKRTGTDEYIAWIDE